jgi:hypothetical protein
MTAGMTDAMDARTVTEQLVAALASTEFPALCDSWIVAGAGFETVEPVLRFMEDNASLDFGTPGPLVHFVERFYGDAYVTLLLESIARKPTEHTVWMLNRVINGTEADPARRERLVHAMEQACRHPLADSAAVNSATRFLKRLLSE